MRTVPVNGIKCSYFRSWSGFAPNQTCLCLFVSTVNTDDPALIFIAVKDKSGAFLQPRIERGQFLVTTHTHTNTHTYHALLIFIAISNTLILYGCENGSYIKVRMQEKSI